MSALAPLFGMPVAFKLGTALGVFLLPLLAYASLRLMRLPFPAPLLGAAAALVFLYVEDNPIWGGTIASTLTGEFSYTYGVGFAVLFLGVLVRARPDGRGPGLPAVVLALTSYAHGYAVLWAGLTASGLLLWDPRRRRGGRFAHARLAAGGRRRSPSPSPGPPSLPLLADWGWTTPYDDAWIDVTTRGLLPAAARGRSSLAGALGARGHARAGARGAGAGDDALLLLLGFGARRRRGARRGRAGPRRDRRALRAARAAVARPRRRGRRSASPSRSLALADVAALGLRAARGGARGLALAGACAHWIDWNYSGLEAKELWPAWRQLTQELRGGAGDPRVAFEYGPVHERAGSIRMHETLPFFSGPLGHRGGLQPVEHDHAPGVLPDLGAVPLLAEPVPQPDVLAVRPADRPRAAAPPRRRPGRRGERPRSQSALDARPEVVREARIPPYTVYRLAGPEPRLRRAPRLRAGARAPGAGWRDQSFRWFSRKPPNRAVLVFTDDPRFDVVAADPWAPPPEVPLPGGVEVTRDGRGRVDPDHDEPSRPPAAREGVVPPALEGRGRARALPRVARAHADGARASARCGSPTPRGTGSDWLGLALAAAALAGRGRRRRARARDPRAARRRRRPAARSGALAALPRPRSSRASPSCASCPGRPHAAEIDGLDERASRAYAAERWDDAAEYARHAVALLAVGRPAAGRAALPPRGGAPARRARARGGRAVHARRRGRARPHRPQALYSGAVAREASGDAGRRRRLAPRAPRRSTPRRRGRAVSTPGGPSPARDRGSRRPGARGATLASRRGGAEQRGPAPPRVREESDDAERSGGPVRSSALLLAGGAAGAGRRHRPPAAWAASSPASTPG